MRSKLFDTKFAEDGLILTDKKILYRRILSISHFNYRHIQNFVPGYESFGIYIKHDSRESTLLYCNIKLRKYAGAGGLRTGFKIPPEIENKITNLRYEYLATLKILAERSGVTPKKRGFLFESVIELLSVFKKTHAAKV